MNKENTDKIVVLDAYVAAGHDYDWTDLKALGDVDIYDRSTTRDEVASRASNAFAVFTNKVVIDEALMQSMPRLRFIGVLATGYNNVDIDAARRRGITVCNVPAYSTHAVAQTVFAHLLNIATRMARHTRSVSKGTWQHCQDFSYRLNPIFELYGKTMGIYGLGNIGMEVARIAHAFGMDVCALTSKSKETLPDYIHKVDKDGLLTGSDVVSLNAPLTLDNHYFIDSDAIEKMRSDAIVINTARGGLVDTSAMAEALRVGRIKAYAADVLETEPPTENNPLIGAPNAFISPHIAWQSDEARAQLLSVSIENLRNYLAGSPTNVVC